MDLLAPRPEIVYLRRRLKLGEGVPVAAVTQNFLSISGPDGDLPVVTQIPEKPKASGRTVLTASSPVVRLSSYQSAIGSLRASGATVYAWETSDRASGVTHVGTHGQKMPEFANRKLVERVETDIIVGLRHFRALRRLILGAAAGDITLTVNDGTQIVANSRDGLDVLHISVIGALIEVRLEPLTDGEDIAHTFNIGF